MASAGIGKWRFDDGEYEQVSNLIHPLSLGYDTSAEIPPKLIIQVFHKSWWRRVWTPQEVWLAKRVALLCGCAVLSAADFLDCCLILEANQALTQGRVTGERFLNDLHLLVNLHGRTLLQLYPPESGRSLLGLLKTVKSDGKECSDLRDYIFGLLGMVDTHC